MEKMQSEETVEYTDYKRKEFREMTMKNLSQMMKEMKIRQGSGC